MAKKRLGEGEGNKVGRSGGSGSAAGPLSWKEKVLHSTWVEKRRERIHPPQKIKTRFLANRRWGPYWMVLNCTEEEKKKEGRGVLGKFDGKQGGKANEVG